MPVETHSVEEDMKEMAELARKLMAGGISSLSKEDIKSMVLITLRARAAVCEHPPVNGWKEWLRITAELVEML
jgi:hypothetical protein